VLIGSGLESLRVHATCSLRVTLDEKDSTQTWPPETWLEIDAPPGGLLRLGDSGPAGRTAEIVPDAETPIRVIMNGADAKPVEARYPGRLRVQRGEDGLLSVYNDVDVESYVAGVVAEEIWPTFEPEAYRAQAVVARTFVLYQMEQAQGRRFDVSACQGSQVYRGVREDPTGRRAAEAARHTRGVVCTWGDAGTPRIFCTYYSAACGGMSQSAALFGPEGAIAPLAGSVACDECRIAPRDTYRWGPVRLSKSDVLARLAGRFPEWRAADELAEIAPLDRTPDGRLLTLGIRSVNGLSRDVLAERFRLAVGGSLMRSTACDIRMTESDVVLENGRGFGHGLGLCQWGAQGWALKGRTAAEILRHYYPGVILSRAY
jgi:stage II sporulation protein D